MKRKLKTFAVVLVFAIFMILPIFLLVRLSEKEMGQYNTDDIYFFKEASYGKTCVVERQDIQQYYSVSGTVSSDKYYYMKIDNKIGDEIRLTKSIGDEIAIDEIIGHIGQNKITSIYNGIVEEISLYDDGYIKIRSLDERILVCMVDIALANKLEVGAELHTEDGRKVVVESISKIAEGEQVKIVLSIENIEFLYGQTVEELKLFSGKVYADVLVINEACVYQKVENGPYYVRILDSYGYFVEEKEVNIGFQNHDVVAVTNLEEGTLCDSGYKSLLLNSEE